MSSDARVLALVAAVAVAASLGILGYYLRPPRLRLSYFGRPLAGTLIVALALIGDRAADPRYFWGIVAGLLLALVADVLLMLPRDLFVYGLAGFAGTHICFLVAFTSGARFAARPLPLAILAVVGLGVVVLIWPGVGSRLRIPVIVYVALLVSMAAQAWCRHLELGGAATLVAAVGATLFLLSDAILSIERFRRPFRAARLAILATFYVADVLIALSVAV